jgi:ribosomal protein S18 acetylase RimI-like enzyme
MSQHILYLSNQASAADIACHLSSCDSNFLPPLSSRVDLNDYAIKITLHARRFEAWVDDTLIGLVAVYDNDHAGGIAYITNVSILPTWTSKGVATHLLQRCIEYEKQKRMVKLHLNVNKNHLHAIKLYEKRGFVANNNSVTSSNLNLHLNLIDVA